MGALGPPISNLYLRIRAGIHTVVSTQSSMIPEEKDYQRRIRDNYQITFNENTNTWSILRRGKVNYSGFQSQEKANWWLLKVISTGNLIT